MADQIGEPSPQHLPDIVPLHPHPGAPADRDRSEPLLRTVLGAVIRQARHDQQRTLAEVADEAGISMPYLSEIERGRKEPSSEVLAAVGRALGLDLVDLVARSYAELAAQRMLEVPAPRPLTVSTPRMPQRAGRSGDVIALAA